MNEKKKNVNDAMCLLIDNSLEILARGSVESSPNAPNIQIRIIDGQPSDVEEAETVQVVSMNNDRAARLGRLIHRRGDMLVLEPLGALSEDVRRNLRMPVCFESCVYPPQHAQKGRIPVKANDLSSGGISFFAHIEFLPGDEMEIVIPITKLSPLILNCQILRKLSESDGTSLYAAKFVDMINEQEMMIREAIFNVQFEVRDDRRTPGKPTR